MILIMMMIMMMMIPAMTLKDSCSILPTISNYTGHFPHTNNHSANR